MRELVVENQEILVIPNDFTKACKGKVTSVSAGDFTLELDNEPSGMLVNVFCEFYTQTSHGKLYFDSYPKSIDGKTLVVASPAKHKFLQRRQYTRIKYYNDLTLNKDNESYSITTLDISAGGMKLKTSQNIDINASYSITLPLSDTVSLGCNFEPIRIERDNKGGYTVSGQFVYSTPRDRMVLTQYCAKRSVEIKNK